MNEFQLCRPEGKTRRKGQRERRGVGMNFSEALKAMKMGNKVSREAWRGKISHWYMTDDRLVEVQPTGFEDIVAVFDPKLFFTDDWFLVT
ncbi:MAG: Thoeris anti-defense Tad2 family protein [Planctomycetota bacterium]